MNRNSPDAVADDIPPPPPLGLTPAEHASTVNAAIESYAGSSSIHKKKIPSVWIDNNKEIPDGQLFFEKIFERATLDTYAEVLPKGKLQPWLDKQMDEANFNANGYYSKFERPTNRTQLQVPFKKARDILEEHLKHKHSPCDKVHGVERYARFKAQAPDKATQG